MLSNMKNMDIYPLKFVPILKRVLWGGQKICAFKQLECQYGDVGESWELSQLPGSVSVVSNGVYKGMTLNDLIDQFGPNLLGQRIFNQFDGRFPLLIKFIDAAADLSIQVHPNDDLALQRHGCPGKSELWYVVDAEPGAKLVSGFNSNLTEELYEKHLQQGTIESVLNDYQVSAGDVFYIPAGRVHALGAGLFIVEIQESSDITYRLYDYNRKDAQGNPRQLHTEWAKDALDYQAVDEGKLAYSKDDSGLVPMVSTKHFIINRMALKSSETIQRDFSELDCFVVYVCVQGEGSLVCAGSNCAIKAGETCLIPSTSKQVDLHSKNGMILLETYL